MIVGAMPVNAASNAAIRLRALDKWYGEYHALRQVHLEIPHGETVVLWGASGSGKTTLLRCLAGLEPVQSGTIELAGVAQQVGPGVRPQPSPVVGMVFQRSALFLNLRVVDNLTIGLRHVRGMPRGEAVALAMHNLARMRLADLAFRYPRQLSGGQQQRAEIARALCMDPKIMLFDEPTAALDPELKHEVGDALAELAGDRRTIVVATHEPSLVHALDPRIVHMAGGAIVGQSNKSTFLSRHPG